MERERNYPNTPWNDVSYGFRYGWEQANETHFYGREWVDIEPDLRTGWDEWEARSRSGGIARQLQQGWEDLKENVRHGWEQARRENQEPRTKNQEP